jgi:hypothetical protein
VVAAYMMVLLGYGFVRYPDAPLHPCGVHDYCGKQGQRHTANEFAQFQAWQTMLEWTWIPGMVVLYLLNRDRIRQRRPR